MIHYQVQKGDTIAQVTKQLNTDWQTLKKQNPNAIGRSKINGNWFLREGATVNVSSSFEKTLQDTMQENQTQSIPKLSSSLQLLDMVQPYIPTVEEKTSTEMEQASENTIEHTIEQGDTIWELAVKKYHVNVEDILRENNISDPTTLQIGQTLTIPLPSKGDVEEVTASWYGEDFHGKPMANGEIYDMYGATIAHKDIPLGTKVELTNTTTGETVQATVSDRGPYVEGRDVDLSYGLAQKLSLLKQGVGQLAMRIL